MQRLKGEDAKKVDSSQATLEKWYEFLETGARNIGFGPNVSEHLHDNYDCGLPAEDGGLIELDDSGRAIYRCSIADKALANWIMDCSGQAFENAISNYGISPEVRDVPDSIRSYLLVYDLLNWSIKKEHITAAKLQHLLPTISPDRIADLITTVKYSSYIRVLGDGEEALFRQAVSAIFKRPDTEIVLFMWSPLTTHESNNWSPDGAKLRKYKNTGAPYVLRQEDKNLLADYIANKTYIAGMPETNTTIYQELKQFRHDIFTRSLDYYAQEETYEIFGVIQNRNIKYSIVDVRYFDDIFDKKFDVDDLITTKIRKRGSGYLQLVNEEYFIVSLNPIDKLMCSTKQTFGSCLSLAKEGDNSGVNGMGATNGLGLFATMPSDAMYLTFMTNGKHKNMYWEEEEWKKDADDRDKSKAYKYFKMTMRQLTYKTYPYDLPNSEVYNEDLLLSGTNQRENFEAAMLRPRLQAGRIYSVANEIVDFELISAWFMHKVGINSNISGYKAFAELVENAALRRTPFYADLFCYGKSTKANFAWWDKYEKRRGIYFDNVTLQFKNGQREADQPFADKAVVKTGRDRTGSHGVTESATDCALDSFKFLRGLQGYTMFNKNVKICSHCGELASENQVHQLPDGNFICAACALEQGYTQCPYCKEWYSPEQADEHTEINLAKYLIRGLSKETAYTCKKKILYAREDMTGQAGNGGYRPYGSDKSKGYICGSCGEIHYLSSWEYNKSDESKFFYSHEIDGATYRFRICGNCLADCVICDCCHEIINMKHSANPVMLMPGKKARVVCRDCAENIRMKKAEKEMLLQAMDATQYVLSTGDFDETYVDTRKARLDETLNSEEAQEFLTDITETINSMRLNRSRYHVSDLLKNINQQIQGMTGRNGKGYPKQKDDSEQVAKLLRHSLVEYTLDIIRASAEGDRNDSEQSTEA